MHWIDWSIIAGYVVLITVIGLAFAKRAGGSTAEFFVAGRNLPWWIAGTSLVATSFAADTPLAITGFVAKSGIAGNWLWWSQGLTWTLAVVFFARLWRRSGIMTDAEFIELRYGGRAGALLRAFKAFYASVIQSTYTLAWVMLGMQKIICATMPAPEWVVHLQGELETAWGWSAGSLDLWKWIVLLGLFAATTAYSMLSGAWGIVITDLIQFTMAMAGSVLFAVYAVHSAGGMAALKEQLVANGGADWTSRILSFFPQDLLPQSGSTWMAWSTMAVYLGILWWGDCGGFVALRMFSTRSERDSVLTAVWYAIAHFALRPWPWIAVALVTLVAYPDLADRESGYPRLLMDILPVGLRGFLLASLVAAFMSTADTHLNWSASYFVNDYYKRFRAPQATERRCVLMSRLSTIVFAFMAIAVACSMKSIGDAWVVLFNLQAGIGMVQMLRWLWWRVNAWSEVSAMIAAFVGSIFLQRLMSPAASIAATAAICTVVWVAVTLLTSPPDRATLERFYRRVRPQALLWGPIARACPDVTPVGGLPGSLLNWILGAATLYAAMLTIGKLVLQFYGDALVSGGICLLAGALLWFRYRGRAATLLT